jgi:hypothetical protein
MLAALADLGVALQAEPQAGCPRTRKVSVLGTLRMSVLWC